MGRLRLIISWITESLPTPEGPEITIIRGFCFITLKSIDIDQISRLFIREDDLIIIDFDLISGV
jgi:hypothetical protein